MRGATFFAWLKKSPVAAVPAWVLFWCLRFVARTASPRGNRIAIISLHKLGDTVFTIPAIRYIMRQHPDAPITVLCYPDSIPVYQAAGINLQFVTVTDKDFLCEGRLASSGARAKLRKVKAVTIFDLSGASYSATLIAGIPAKAIAGCNDLLFKGVYTRFLPVRGIPHLSDIYLDAAGAPRDASREQFKLFAGGAGGNYAALMPSAGWKAKEWGIARFTELGVLLLKRTPVTMVLPAGVLTEDERSAITGSGIALSETPSVAELIAKIKDASVVIGNDSGPIHIGAMLGKPTFTIYGPTHPAYHIPYGTGHGFVRAAVPCVPLTAKYCHTHGGVFCPDVLCMHSLAVTVVHRAVSEFLNSLQRGAE